MSVVHHVSRAESLLPRASRWFLLAACGVLAQAVPAADDLILDEASPPSATQVLPLVGNMQAFVIRGNVIGGNVIEGNKEFVFGGQALQGRAVFPRQRPVVASPTVNLGSLFDRMVFVPELNGRLRPPDEGGIDILRTRGAARLALLDRICRLSLKQQRMLQLTLASDLAGFEAGYEAARARYVGTDMSVRPAAIDRELMAALQADAAVCRGQWQQLFGSVSLLAVVEHQLLDPEQADRFQAWLADHRAELWQAMVAEVLLEEDARRFWKSPQAAADAVAVMNAAVPPLAVFDAAIDPAVAGRMKKFQRLLVHLRLGRIYEPTLRSFADPDHWGRLRYEIDRAIAPGVEQVEQQLIARQVLQEVQR